MDWISSLLLATVRLAIPLLLISLAELYGQRAGMVNIGLEGLAAIGALVGFLTCYITGSNWIGLLCGALAGLAVNMIYAFSTVTLCADHTVSSDAPDLEAVRRSRKDQSPSMLGQGVLQVCAMADLVFLALHGSCGEDGRIQATLDLLGVPYTGSNYVSSGMAMDKAITKRFMDAEGIRTAPWHDVRYTEADIPGLVEKLEVPCAVS